MELFLWFEKNVDFSKIFKNKEKSKKGKNNKNFPLTLIYESDNILLYYKKKKWLFNKKMLLINIINK